jgi:hypothetical protein
MKRLTKAQLRALEKLGKAHKAVTAFDIGEQCRTLEILVRHGYAIKGGGGLGSAFSPETSYTYKIKPRIERTGLC